MMKQTRYLTVVFAALFPVMLLSATQSGCGKKDEDDTKPTATAAPPPPPPPPTTPAVVIPEEDAGLDAGLDADASDAKVVVGVGGASASIAKCCAALQQNANSAPIEQKGAYQAAAAACQGLRNTPVAQQAFAQIRSFLLGAKMPGACQ
jgi:hypothetical protein